MNGRLALAAATAALLVLAGCALGDGPRRIRDRDIDRGNPSAIVATEIALARAAQEQGQWTAFAEFAADDAVMFVPQPVNARDWLKQQANPAQAVQRQPHQVWSSCDGSLSLSKGSWQSPDGSVGYFTTAWKRQRNGEHRWTMDQDDELAQPLPRPERIQATVADCTTRPPPPAMAATSIAPAPYGISDDGTLYWQVILYEGGSRHVVAEYWDGTAWQEAIAEQVAGEISAR